MYFLVKLTFPFSHQKLLFSTTDVYLDLPIYLPVLSLIISFYISLHSIWDNFSSSSKVFRIFFNEEFFQVCFFEYVFILSLFFWKIVWLSMKILIYRLFSPSSVKIYFTIFWHPLWLLGSDFMSNPCSFVDSSLYFLVDFDISSLSLVLCGFMMTYQAVDFFLILSYNFSRLFLRS